MKFEKNTQKKSKKIEPKKNTKNVVVAYRNSKMEFQTLQTTWYKRQLRLCALPKV